MSDPEIWCVIGFVIMMVGPWLDDYTNGEINMVVPSGIGALLFFGSLYIIIFR
jgi:hypothetical protein